MYLSTTSIYFLVLDSEVKTSHAVYTLREAVIDSQLDLYQEPER